MFIYIYSLEACNLSCQCFLVSLRQNTQKSCQRTLAWNLSHFHSSTSGSTNPAKPQPLFCAPALLDLLRSEPRMMPIRQSCERNIPRVNVRYKLTVVLPMWKAFLYDTDPRNSDLGSYLTIYLHLYLKYYLSVCVTVCACTLTHMQRSEGSFVASGLSFHLYVGSGD